MIVLKWEDLAEANRWGRLKVTRAAAPEMFEGEIEPPDRSKTEVETALWRELHMKVADEMIKAREMKGTRREFIRHASEIATRARRRYLDDPEVRKMRKSRRAVMVGVDKIEIDSGRRLHGYYCDWKTRGLNGLYTNFHLCGRKKFYSHEVDDLVAKIIRLHLDEERPSKASIAESVRAVFRKENERRRNLPDPLPELRIPGYDYVVQMIHQLAPVEFLTRTRGWKVTESDLHGVGVGLTFDRLFQCVFYDDYTTDVNVLLEATGILEWLTDAEKAEMGLDGSPQRVTLGGALEGKSRGMPGFKISLNKSVAPLRDVLEMTYIDKTDISDAAGCVYRWEMHGVPETVILDRGPNFMTEAAYRILADLGITNFGGPVHKPWLRALMERLFGTIHKTLLMRFEGRTFSNVVQKGENDAEARAGLTLEGLLKWLTRWIVDIYHNTRHTALGMTPLEKWQLDMMSCPPLKATQTEMRHAFGTKLTRKVSQRGIRAMQIDYNTAELMSHFNGTRYGKRTLSDEVEIRWWSEDIGVIEVKVGPGEWITVTAANERWIGQSFETYMTACMSLSPKDCRSEDARYQAILEIDEETLKRKCLSKMIVVEPFDENWFARMEDRLCRHMDTADKRFDRPAPMGLLSNEIGSSSDDSADSPSTGAVSGTFDVDDLME